MPGKTDNAKPLEQALLSAFQLYPGMTLKEAARGYIDNNRKRMDPSTLLFVAACAIQSGNDALAAVILGVDADSS